MANMVSNLTKPGLHLTLLLVAAMVFSSCGRRGDLEAPGTIQNEDGTIERQETPEPPREDKPFVLDPLL